MWSVSEVAIGAVFEAVVDDKTGGVVSIKRWPGR
jgi:hypothetical protein